MQGFIYLYKLIYLGLLPSQILDLYCLVGRFEFVEQKLVIWRQMIKINAPDLIILVQIFCVKEGSSGLKLQNRTNQKIKIWKNSWLNSMTAEFMN